MRRDKPCGVSKASRSARSSARWWLQESCLLSLMDGKGKDVLFRKAWQDWKKRRVSRIIQMPGGVAERPIAPVLKTGVAQVTEGSNPSPSALSFCSDKSRFARNGRTFHPFGVCGPFVRLAAILHVILLRLILRL